VGEIFISIISLIASSLQLYLLLLSSFFIAEPEIRWWYMTMGVGKVRRQMFRSDQENADALKACL
jgi:hypothetical protein